MQKNIEAIRQLLKEYINNKRITYGMNFSTNEFIYKPLEKQGYSNIPSAVRYLLERMYFIESTNMGNIEFTTEGWDWVAQELEQNNHQEEIFKLSPEFYGLGINLKKLCKKIFKKSYEKNNK